MVPIEPSGASMKRTATRSLLSLAATFPLALAMFLLQPSPVSPQDENVQTIEIAAKKYEYLPSPVHLKRGTKVQLRITATDHDHGFKIAVVPDGTPSKDKPGLIFTSVRDCWELKQGQATTIEFVAQTPGMYTFHCCHHCGLGHGGMKGQIVVE
jgi:cytochrome c oxidase subunit II